MARALKSLPSQWCTVAFLTVVGATTVSAQDAHYWTVQYGTRSGLLGGAVIGSVADISGTFYNPGALARADSLGFAIAAQVFEIERGTLRDGGGPGIDLVSNRSGVKPNLIGGTIPLGFLGSNVLAYSLITRQEGNADVIGRILDPPLDPGSGLDYLAGEIRLESTFNETWAGLSFASPLGGQKFGLGATWYVAFRTQRRREQVLAEALQTSGTADAAIVLEQFNYTNLRTLGKVGAFYRGSRITAGLTLTTPSVRIAGVGDYGANEGVFVADSGRVAPTYQEELRADYRSPFSVGGGISVGITPSTRIHGSIEWFDALDQYDVLDPQPFEDQATGDAIPASVVDERRSVVNWGLGIEQRISASWTGFASFATDNSTNPEGTNLGDISLANWNLLLFSIGADLRVGNNHITLGATVGWGDSEARQLVNFLEAVAGRPIGESRDVRFHYRVIRFLFGFET